MVAHDDNHRQIVVFQAIVGLVHADEIAGEGERLPQTVRGYRVEQQAMFGRRLSSQSSLS